MCLQRDGAFPENGRPLQEDVLVTSSINTTAFRALLAIVMLAPLPLGSNRPWSWSLLSVLIGAVAGGWALAALAGRCRSLLPGRRLWVAGCLLILALLWAALQTSSLLPVTAWHPLWSESASALGIDGGAVSVSPEATWTAIMRLCCYAAVFLLAAQLGAERARAHEMLVAMVLAGAAYAGYGLYIYFSGTEVVLLTPKQAYLGDLTSTFINRNAYGAYAGLGLTCCVAMFAHRLRARYGRRGAAEWTENLLVRAIPYLVGALLIGSALLLTHSRGAFLSSGLALAVLMVALTAARALQPQTALRIGTVILAIAAGTVVVNGEATLERLLETGNPSADEGRPDAYRLTIAAIADAPLTGHGLGAFQPAFRMYRDAALHQPEEWRYAHNIYLEMAMDVGLPAAIAFYASCALILGSCIRGLYRRRRDHVYPAVAIAAVTLVGAHGLIDFSAQIPAVAVTLALLLGVGFAQSWSSRSPSHEDSV